MNPRSRHTQAPHILPFGEWVEAHYPAKTPMRSVLKLIGALDLAYLVYRLTAKPQASALTAAVQSQPTPKAAPKTRAPRRAPARTHGKKHTAPAEAAPQPAELTIEFPVSEEQPMQITPAPTKEPVPTTPEPQPEPEPLVIEEEAPSSAEASSFAEATKDRTVSKRAPVILRPSLVWIDAPSLDGEDLRRTDVKTGVDGTPVILETRDIDDERETLIVVGNNAWRATTISPALDLSQMLQIVRVTHGELYVLGRMALGAVSYEGYVPAEEAARIVRTLTRATAYTDIDVEYFTKDKTSRTRKPSTLTVRFVPVEL